MTLTPALLALQQRLQYTFARPELLQKALTHRSFSADHNERLEFLGDCVLNLAISDLLFKKLEGLPEGSLSRARSNLINQDALCQIACQLQLDQSLRLGEGELRSGGLHRPSILADTLEAIIGAVYLDAGFPSTLAVVDHLYRNTRFSEHMGAMNKDPKTTLQELLQAQKIAPPTYQVVQTEGAAHARTFRVQCTIAPSGHSTYGSGASRRSAEQMAADLMLEHLGKR